MRLDELKSSRPFEKNIEFHGFKLRQERVRDDDVTKIYHHITVPGDKVEQSADFTPYQYIDAATFHRYIKFYKEHDRLPSRKDIKGSNSPLDANDLKSLVP